MPAPTALKSNVQENDNISSIENSGSYNSAVTESGDAIPEDLIIDVQTTMPITLTKHDNKTTAEFLIDEEGRPQFSGDQNSMRKVVSERRAVAVPPHRFTPLKNTWTKVYYPLVDHLKLQVKMDIKKKRVLLRTSRQTTDKSAIQKGDDFLKAFMLGFDIDDATALLRLDDLYIESFEIKDIKTLHGDHLSRAIGRIAGKDGKMKFSIENATRTRVVLAETKIHILGGFKNIKMARESVVSLILGKPPSKIYGNLRIVSSRMKERF